MTCLALLLTQPAAAQQPGMGRGWLSEFDHAANQLVALAEAIPAEKFSWRPGPGVRSTSEVFMHIAVGNYWLLGQTGAKLPENSPKVPANPEKAVTEKTEVIGWLKGSIEAARHAYPVTDKSKAVRFFGGDATSGDVFLRLLVHNHEHMGQSIAYARMMGVRPPWSKSGSE